MVIGGLKVREQQSETTCLPGLAHAMAGRSETKLS